jgi:hypothetical protein
MRVKSSFLICRSVTAISSEKLAKVMPACLTSSALFGALRGDMAWA